MGKTMKSSAIKTIVVSLTADNVSEFEVDTEVFEDPFLEAATRAVEKCKKNKGAIIRPVTSCWEKELVAETPEELKKKTVKKSGKKMAKDTHLYNSYWILVNAGCYQKAEQLREKFKMQHNIDLKNEPLHARNPGPK